MRAYHKHKPNKLSPRILRVRGNEEDPRNTWWTSPEAETRKINYIWRQIENIAQNRNRWRALVWWPKSSKEGKKGRKALRRWVSHFYIETTKSGPIYARDRTADISSKCVWRRLNVFQPIECLKDYFIITYAIEN